MLTQAARATLIAAAFLATGCVVETESEPVEVGQDATWLAESAAGDPISHDGPQREGATQREDSDDRDGEDSDTVVDDWIFDADPDPEPWTPGTKDEGAE